MTPPIIQLVNRSAETENKSAINEKNSGWNKFGLNIDDNNDNGCDYFIDRVKYGHFICPLTFKEFKKSKRNF